MYDTFQSHCMWFLWSYKTNLKTVFKPQDKPQDTHTATKNHINPNWLSEDVQERTNTPPIPFAKKRDTEEHHTNTIRVKMRRNPTSTTSKTYRLHMEMFENLQP